LTGEIGDTYTDEGFQRKGLFASLVNRTREEAEREGIHYIYGTPNNHSLPGYQKKCNFSQVASLPVHSFTLPLAINSITPKRFLLGIFSDFLNVLYSVFLNYYFSSRRGDIKIVEIREFDRSFDMLWTEASRDYDFVFLRDSNTLNWRFCSAPFAYRKLAIYRAGRLVGYIVIRDSIENGTVFIADYFFLRGELASLKIALRQVAKKGLTDGRRKVTAWISLSDYLLPAFESTLFIKRRKVPVITYENELSRRVTAGVTTHFSLSDSDNI
jgi:hypothetical protein